MIELGQLEKQHAEFAKRGVKIVAISNDDQAISQETQAAFPHLVIVSDKEQSLARAVQVIHEGAAHDGGDTNAPTTFLLDKTGTVRWLFRPNRFLVRVSPESLLSIIDASGVVAQ